MSARIAQRSNDQSRWTVSVSLRRGTTAVDWTNDTGVRYMPFRDGIGFIAWDFEIPTVVPASGLWSFYCPILSEFDAQDIGVLIAGGAVSPATLNTGVITGGSLVPGGRATIRGMVTI